jgi:Zn-dependent protease with chaperone function
MAATGFVSHVREAQRSLIWLVAAYLVAFQAVGGLVAYIFVGIFDPANTLFANPLGYFARYGLWIGALALALFAFLYFRHTSATIRALDIRPVSRIDEPRFVRIAEEQCITQGVRKPRFGLIEAPQPNALAVGEGPDRGMIAVTRGLLDHLDDEELAAVLAHEVAHIRNGDTRVLAANHALMRTAVHLQVNNALRFEDWKQAIVPLFFPPLLFMMLLSGYITMTSMRLAREARRGINLSRDFAADAASVRATHFPDALISALHKLSGRGGFANCEGYEDCLFEGRSAGDGGSHPDVSERIDALHRLAGQMIDLNRVRRDTRLVDPVTGIVPQARPVGGFGRRGLTAETALAFRASGIDVPPPPPPRVREKPELIPNDQLFKLMISDFAAYKAHMNKVTDYYEWRESDQRNFLGLKPEMRIPVAACFAFLLVFHWPSDGDFKTLAYKFSPTWYADIGLQTQGTFCSGPSYPDGKCPQG